MDLLLRNFRVEPCLGNFRLKAALRNACLRTVARGMLLESATLVRHDRVGTVVRKFCLEMTAWELSLGVLA